MPNSSCYSKTMQDTNLNFTPKLFTSLTCTLTMYKVHVFLVFHKATFIISRVAKLVSRMFGPHMYKYMYSIVYPWIARSNILENSFN